MTVVLSWIFASCSISIYSSLLHWWHCMELRSHLYSNCINMTMLNALFLFEKYKRIARHCSGSHVQIFWQNKQLGLHQFLLWSKAVLSLGGDLREDFKDGFIFIDLTAAVIRAVISAEFIEKLRWILIVWGMGTRAPVTQINTNHPTIELTEVGPDTPQG